MSDALHLDMKLALLMMMHRGDAPYLVLHLPVISAVFDGAVFVFDPLDVSDDEMDATMLFLTSPLADGKRMAVVNHEFKNNWSDMLNVGIKRAETEGYTAVLRLDPDELLHPTDVNCVRAELERVDVLTLPRYNFFGDRLHYAPQLLPDYQTRAFRLNCGAHYEGQHHERLVSQTVTISDAKIFHYGWVGRQRILERDFHYLQVAREKEGLPPLTERPADRTFPHWDTVPFVGEQPINALECGIYAPWKE